MTTEISFSLNVENIIPHGDASASKDIVALWRTAADFFNDIDYQCALPSRGTSPSLKIRLDLLPTLKLIENAINSSESLDAYRQQHSENGDTPLNSSLLMTISADSEINIDDAYNIASIFQQQFYLAMNLTLPGSCQLLGVRFDGENAHLYEAQSFTAKVFYDARMSSHQQEWPNTHILKLEDTWNWLNKQGLSQTDIAISDINKALINMLKLAQQRQRYGSRSALLASQLLSLLLDCRHGGCPRKLRNRTQLVLGTIPESADCFIDLLKLRADFFEGDHPVRRPALISHTPQTENREQIASHNATIELAVGIIVGLLQQLVLSNKDKYQFEEHLVN